MEMNIHQALSELKLLNSRINKLTDRYSNDYSYIGVAKESSTNMQQPIGVSIENYKSLAQGNMDSAFGLINRYNAIKSAVVLSNAITKVTIGGVEMTVAEAIERKTTVKYEKALLSTLINQRNKVHTSVLDHNMRVDAEIDAEIDRMNQSTDKRDNVFLKEYRESQEKLRKLQVVDPLGLDVKIKALEERIGVFESEVDYVLSTSNAITKITID